MKKDASDIKKVLLCVDDEKLPPEYLKQLVDYAPDSNEVTEISAYVCFFVIR